MLEHLNLLIKKNHVTRHVEMNGHILLYFNEKIFFSNINTFNETKSYTFHWDKMYS